MKRKSSQEILRELEAENDGLATRPIGIWTLEKLAILHLYFHGFTSASRKARGGVCIDGLAGPGLCEVRGARMPPRFVWGSPLLAARAAPPFERCILIEKNQTNAQALSVRTLTYGDRIVVRARDVNDELAIVMRDEVPPEAPCFCLLDPEGLELSWQTIESAALVPRRQRKPEFLVLFPSSWLMRLLPKKGIVNPRHEDILDRLMPERGWRDVYQFRLQRKISPSEAKDRYVELYREGFEALGYRAFSHPIQAPSIPGGKRRERYQLIFATEHEAGAKIMLDVFERPYVLDFPVTAQQPLFD
jgi:three-Cys-motif partner protein